MRDAVVIDTNVLLRDPQAIFAYPGVEVIIPQTVLSELDRIKTTRSDKEIRFKGREISRMLFELSEYGPLVDGIELDNDSIVKVVPYNPNIQLPQPLTAKNPDDRILGCAWQTAQRHPDIRVTLVTNDLNMLLKAQTLGLPVQQHEVAESAGRLSRFWRSYSHRRVNLLWFLVPVGLLVAVALLWAFRVPSPVSSPSPSPITDPLRSFATQELEYLQLLRREPDNVQAWIQLASLQSDWADALQNDGRQAEAREKYEDATDSYRRAVNLRPNDAAVRTSLAAVYFKLGNTEQTITELLQAQNSDPNYAEAYFALGWVAWKHNRDYSTAIRQFETYLRIAPNGPRATSAHESLRQIQEELRARQGS